MMKTVVLVASVVGILLGGLWVLQGFGLIHVRPFLCFANCREIEGPSSAWAIAGLLLSIVGLFGITYWLRQRVPR